MAGHWSPSHLHFESFADGGVARPDDRPFRVRTAKSGLDVEVPVGQSILAVLREHGCSLPSSCESGTCGTCRTTLLEGAGRPPRHGADARGAGRADHDLRVAGAIGRTRARPVSAVRPADGTDDDAAAAAQRPVRLGVAGLGRAFTLMLPTFLGDPRIELVAACDPREAARAQFARDFAGASILRQRRGARRRPGGRGGLHRQPAPVPCRAHPHRRRARQACAGGKADGDHARRMRRHDRGLRRAPACG